MLRIEKGHVGGAEINGQTTARDLGLGGMVTADKDCIGKVLAQRPALLDPARPIVVGVKPVDPCSRSPPARISSLLAPMLSSPTTRAISPRSPSPVLGQDIGIGFLARGRDRIGERIRAVDLCCAGTMWNASSPRPFSTILTESAPMAEFRFKRSRPSPACSSRALRRAS